MKSFPRPPDISPVVYDRYSLIIRGRRVVMVGGEFHYWRLPVPDQWGRVLSRMRGCGLNAVSIYFHWGYHSAEQGSYDFSGMRDVERLLREAERAGLYVIARPGPYINAETDVGGYPGWMLSTGARFRSSDPASLAVSGEWFDRILPILARHQLHRGGSIVLMQVENEVISGDRDLLRALYRMMRRRGIEVPLFHDDALSGFGHFADEVDISGHNCYPAGFDGRKPWSMDAVAKDIDGWEKDFREECGQTHIPLFVPEYQGGTFDGWGGAGYQACYENLDADFIGAANQGMLAQGATAINLYMFHGGTNWGYLGDANVYTSYDYGASIREWLSLGPRYDANKRWIFFATAVQKILARTDRQDDRVRASNPSLLQLVRVNPETKTLFIFLRNMDEVEAHETTLELPDGIQARRVPRVGTIALRARRTKILVANYAADFGAIVYSTSELLTHETQGGQETWVFWGDRGEIGEILLETGHRPAAASGVEWTEETSGIRLNYTHQATPGYMRFGNVLVLVVDETAASSFWRVPLADGVLLVQGGYHIGAPDENGSLPVETAGPERLRFFGGKLPACLRLDLQPEFGLGFLEVGKELNLPDLPELTDWIFRAEPFEGAPGWDDAAWSPVDRFHSLSPWQHGFYRGYVWYRGRFRATGEERAIQITTGLAMTDGPAGGGGSQANSMSVWINGIFLGIDQKTATTTLEIPPGLLGPEKENVLAILTENLGKFGPSTDMGVGGVRFMASSPDVEKVTPEMTWRLQGGLSTADFVRGPYNASGLYGERHRWYETQLEPADDSGWAGVTLPHEFAGPDEWVGWYRTSFDLNLPADLHLPLGLVFDGRDNGGDKALLFINGYLFGRYWPERGPQTKFYLPPGVLQERGTNTIAIAVWRRHPAKGILGRVHLEPWDITLTTKLQLVAD